MKTSSRHRLFIGSVLLLLLLGLVNYILFQPHALFLRFFPVKTELHPLFSSAFLTGYFSDMTWCAALCMTVVVLGETRPLKRNSKLFLLSLPFITEAAQGLHLMNGTFDWYDMLLYGLLLLVFSLVFPSLHFYQMGKRKLQTWPLVIFTGFLVMAVASASPKQTTYQPKPDPCITHTPITYSPVLLKIYISGTYTMKDLSGAQRSGSEYLVDALNALSPSKYRIADGVQANLDLNITINTDSYEHYGASVYMYANDNRSVSQGRYIYRGYVYSGFPNDYVTPQKLFDDIASKFNWFITGGWCQNCQSPCNPRDLDNEPPYRPAR